MSDERNQPDQQEQLQLRYRAAQDDLRPQKDEDIGCAIVFGMIALGLLAMIAWAGYGWRAREMSVGELISLSIVGLLAGGAVIAVCGRLTRHRWWGNIGWKDVLIPRSRRKDGD